MGTLRTVFVRFMRFYLISNVQYHVKHGVGEGVQWRVEEWVWGVGWHAGGCRCVWAPARCLGQVHALLSLINTGVHRGCMTYWRGVGSARDPAGMACAVLCRAQQAAHALLGSTGAAQLAHPCVHINLGFSAARNRFPAALTVPKESLTSKVANSQDRAGKLEGQG